MDITDILLIIGFGLGIQIILVFVVYILRRRSSSIEHYMSMQERTIIMMRDEMAHLSRRQERSEAFAPELSGIRKATTTPMGDSSIVSVDELVGELSHALNTPLSLIEATLINLRHSQDRPISEKTSDERLRKSLDFIETGVTISKAVLAAYRELIKVADPTSWSPDSVAESAQALVRAYAAKEKKQLDVDITLPDSIPGYSNNYVLALLLPLIENAVDAAPPKSTVSLAAENSNGTLLVHVRNLATSTPQDTRIFNDRYTSKDGHEGRGLSIVQHLLAAHKGASLSHRVEGETVTFSVALPIGEPDGH